MSVRVWKRPDCDALLIQFDGDAMYEIPEGLLELVEADPADATFGEWFELTPAACHDHQQSVPCEDCRQDGGS